MFCNTLGVSLIVVLVSLACPAKGRAEPQTVPAGLIDARVTQEVDAAEASFTTALIAADIPRLEQLLADDFTWTHTTGGVEMKKEYLRGVLDTRRYKAFKREGTTFRVYETAAISSGNVHITVSAADRGERILHIRYTAVYVSQDGGWRLAAWHNTRLAE